MTLIGFTVSSYLNSLVDSHHRATVLSFKGVAFTLAYAGVSLLFALLLQLFHHHSSESAIAHAFALLPLWLLLIWVAVLVAFRKYRKLINGRIGT